MNVGNILKVAEAIEQASVPGLGFNMGLYFGHNGNLPDMSGHHCGTTACIAGWGWVVMGRNSEDFRLQDNEVSDWFGVTDDARCDLFAPQGLWDTDTVTPSQAARVLRILAITGKVDWEAAMKSDEPTMPALPVAAPKVRA